MQHVDVKTLVKKVNNVLLNNALLKFFGLLLYRFPKVVISEAEYKVVSQQIGFKFQAATDFKKIYLYLQSHSSYQSIIFSLVHELLHILGRHHARIGDRNKELWNVVTDHCINETILKLNSKNCAPEETDILFKDIMHDFPFIQAEKLYDMFTKSCQQKTKQIQMPDGSMKEVDVEETTYELNYKGDHIKVQGNKLIHNDKVKEIENHIRNMGDKAAEKKLHADATMLWNSNIVDKGSMGEAVRAFFDNLLEIKLDYRELLADALKTTLVRSVTRSWRTLNKLIYVTPLPGRTGFDQQIDDMLFLFDVSSSCSKEDVKTCISIGYDAMKNADVANLEIVTHNTHIVEKFSLNKEEQNFEPVLNMKIGGGTSHRHVFEYVRDQVVNHDREFSIIIVMTDYESDIEEIIMDYPEIHHIPFVFMLSLTHYKPQLPMLDHKTIYVETIVER